MKIKIGSDHGGFELKDKIYNYLKEKKYDISDIGTYSEESCDYVDFAEKVASSVSKGEVNRGILICGTGIGMSITANKFPGVRASLCTCEYHALKTREDNDSNVLTLGGRFTTFEIAKLIVETWLKTEFHGGRHQRRINKIKDIEDNNFK